MLEVVTALAGKQQKRILSCTCRPAMDVNAAPSHTSTPFFYADNFRPVFSITLLLSLLSYSLSPTLSLLVAVCLSVFLSLALPQSTVRFSKNGFYRQVHFPN